LVFTEQRSERTIAKCFPLLRRHRKCSPIIRPGALVAIGLNGPRYSTGASGFKIPHIECDEPR